MIKAVFSKSNFRPKVDRIIGCEIKAVDQETLITLELHSRPTRQLFQQNNFNSFGRSLFSFKAYRFINA